MIVASTDPDANRRLLLRMKLGGLLDWRVPELLPGVGPHDPAVFATFEAARLKIVEACSERLKGYSDDKIAGLLNGPDDKEGISAGWRDFLKLDVQKALVQIPPWYAGGFGHPEYAADFDYWAKMPGFKVEELLSLSVGVEPGQFPLKDLLALSAPQTPGVRRLGIEFDGRWPTVQFLVRRYDLLNRTFNPGGYDVRISPKEFLRWVEKVDFETHPVFLRHLAELHLEPGARQMPGRGGQKPDKREVDMIAQLFTAIVVTEYGYDPDAAKSPIPREIVDIAASLGISVSDETVRKYLKIGASFLPPDWKPN
jgi:hypothetical protein